MNNRCLINIIIPCYNVEFNIEKLITNLNQQTKENFRIIYVDDCSCDGTLALVEKHYKQKANNLEIIILKNKRNMGAARSRNLAMDLLKPNEYFMFVDADDLLKPYTLDRIYNYLNKNQVDVLFFDCERIVNKSSMLIKQFNSSQEINKKNAFLNTFPGPVCKVFKTDILIRHNLRMPDLPINEDMPFVRCLISHCTTIGYLNETLYVYKDNTNSLTHNYKNFNLKNEIIAFEYIKSYASKSCEFLIDELYIREVYYSCIKTLCYCEYDKKYIVEKIQELEEGHDLTIRDIHFTKIQKIYLFLIKNKWITLMKVICRLEKKHKKMG